MKRWAIDCILLKRFFGDGKGYARYGDGNVVLGGRSPNANVRRNNAVSRTFEAPAPCSSCTKKTVAKKTPKPVKITTGRAKKTVAKRPTKPTGKYANRLKSATLARRGSPGLKFLPGLRDRLRSV